MVARGLQRQNALSLDVVAASVSGAVLAACVCRARLPVGWLIALACAVYAIYAADRLLDGRRLGQAAKSFRHRFHQRRYAPLAVGAAIAALTGFVAAILNFTPRLWFGALVVAALTVAHLALAQWSAFEEFPREISVAVLYTAGVWHAALLEGDFSRGVLEAGFCILLFVMAALSNLLCFSLYDFKRDEGATPNSFVIRAGRRRSSELLFGLALAGALIACVWFVLALGGSLPARLPLWTPALMAALVAAPAFVWKHRKRFRKRDLYRAVCDGALLLFAAPALATSL